jgi:hypothetical protein
MENEILFSESQKFKQWWFWGILLLVNGLVLFGTYKQVISGQQVGDKPIGNTGPLLTTGLTMLSTILILTFRLDTKIKRDGIYVRFFPFHLSFRRYTWDNISKSFVRQYNPIIEYGGWGLRFGLFGKGKALNVSGNKGLQLEFSNSKRLLVGTNKPEELTETLKKIGQLKL